jgi:hypothetical protein
MNLRSLIDKRMTDKDTLHSYLDTYENLFKDKRETATNILEIGIAEGGSLNLWRDYFNNAHIYGIDIADKRFNDVDRITCLFNTNASLFNTEYFKDKFDIIIDDGSHNLTDQCVFIEKYLPLLKDDGILIIEDVQDIQHLNIFTNITPEEFKPYIETYDLRKNIGRYDDILFVINKNKKS